jgi:hypothetical protein
MLRKGLLACGLVASLLYVAIDVLAALVYPDYHRFASQTLSELMANGAPTERLVDPPLLLYNALMIAFAAGLWLTSARGRVRVTAGLLLAYAAIGFTGPTLFEMNVRGGGPSPEDARHIALTAVMGVFILAAVAAGAGIRGRAFRRYSWATFAALIGLAALTGIASQGLAEGAPTPLVGVWERLDIAAFLAWVAVLAGSEIFGRTHDLAHEVGAHDDQAPRLDPAAPGHRLALRQR